MDEESICRKFINYGMYNFSSLTFIYIKGMKIKKTLIVTRNCLPLVPIGPSMVIESIIRRFPYKKTGVVKKQEVTDLLIVKYRTSVHFKYNGFPKGRHLNG